MKYSSKFLYGLFAVFLVITVQYAGAGSLPHPDTYIPTFKELDKYKKYLDDPRSFIGSPVDVKNIVPSEILDMITFDVEKMKNLWPEVVGFKAPDVVGKTAPEIKPGKYTYQDLEKIPGLKDLIIPERLDSIKPGGPPFIGNIPEFEILPTRQLYLPLPVAEACLKNMGKAKLDEDGYLIQETLAPGILFPRPSGQFKGIQLIYNHKHRYNQWGMNQTTRIRAIGVTKNLKLDFDCRMEENIARLTNRILAPPYGWYDNRAEKRGEHFALFWNFLKPRDVAGTVKTSMTFLDKYTMDQNLLYIPSMRRVRKMSATDTQDPVMGQDIIYDDTSTFWQKLSPEKYPYTYEVEEREYLIPLTISGTTTVDSKNGYALKNVEMERRPIYRVIMTQLDKNYVYGKRIIYMDRETFDIYFTANYDQEGQLYRTTEILWGFYPDSGMTAYAGSYFNMVDHIDLHSSFLNIQQYPCFWDIRKDLGMARIYRQAK
jgi:uncharacterized protein DUF1329